MKRIGGLLIAAVVWLAAPAAWAFGPLEAPGAAMGDALILDIRSPEDFAKGHLPGAVNAPYGVFRGPKENPGRVPDAARLEAALRAVGADPARAVLVVHQGKDATDFGAAARVYWTLKSAGFDTLAILNGGVNAWLAAGMTLSTEAAAPTPSDMQLTLADTWWISTEGVADVVDGRSDAVLIDARPHEFFLAAKKHDAAKAPGTLASALNIVHASWFAKDSGVVDAPQDMIAQVRKIAADHPGAPLVSFCNTGHWAATNWFVASELAGIEGVKLYPESMVGWTLLGNAVVAGN